MICIAGKFETTTTSYCVESLFISNGDTDILMLKLSKNGDLLWTKHVGSKGSDNPYTVTTDLNNNIFLSGHYADTIDLDPGSKTKYFIPEGTTDGFLQKLNTNGELIWNKILGGPGYCVPGRSKVVGKKIYLTGYFTDSLFVDSASVPMILANKSRTLANTYIVILDTLGNFINHTSYGGRDRVNGKAIEVDKDENIFTSGSFNYEGDFSTSKYTKKLKSKGGDDGYISYLNNSLSLNWVLQQGSAASNDQTESLYLDNSRYLYASGNKGVYGYISKIDKCNNSYISRTETHCDSLKSPSGKYVWRKTGIYYDTIIDRYSCIYYYTIDLTIQNSSVGYIKADVCDKFRSPKTTLTKSGTYIETITNRVGCDSIITIDLIVRHSSFIGTGWTTCDSVTSPSGKYTWSTPGYHRDTLTNNVGCDSIILIDLAIQTSVSSPYFRTCDSFTSPSGKYNWYKTGEYHDTIANAFGCDSVMTVKLKIDTTTWENKTYSDCEGVTSPSGKYVWNEPGTYYDTIKNLHGCGHIITANVKIPKTQYTQHVVGCQSYISPSGKFSWTNSGKYYDTLTNAVGCDSIIITNLIVDKERTSVYQSKEVLVANAKDKNYQWFDCKNGIDILPNETNRSFVAQKNGSYGVIVWDHICTDTSQCYQISSLSANKIEKHPATIFPNPTSGSFTVWIQGTSETFNYTITNTKGSVMKVGQAISSDTIDFKQPTGVYFISITNGNASTTIPIIVQ